MFLVTDSTSRSTIINERSEISKKPPDEEPEAATKCLMPSLRTSAERKDYSILPKVEIKEECKSPCRSQQVSVIQRTPAQPLPDSSSEESADDAEPYLQEPEQEEPIDYHVPKKVTDTADEIKPRTAVVPAYRRHQPIAMVGRKYAKSTHILMAAAGHLRNNNNNGQCNGNAQNGAANGANRNTSGGHANYNGNGVVYNGGYNGAVNGGSDRSGDGSMNGGGGGNAKCGYESGGSPVGTLPPFYESLKGGHLAGYQQQVCNQYGNSLPNEHIGMDYDTGQDMLHFNNLISAGAELLPLHNKYSMLQDMYALGISMKDDEDATSYLKDAPIFNYDDALMIDAVSNGAVDPLQFTSLNFANSSDNGQILDMPNSPDLFMREVSNFIFLFANERCHIFLRRYEAYEKGSLARGIFCAPIRIRFARCSECECGCVSRGNSSYSNVARNENGKFLANFRLRNA